MKSLLPLFFLVFVSLVNTNISVAAAYGNVEHCSTDAKSINTSVTGHSSQCNNINCTQYSLISKKVAILEVYTPQSTAIIFSKNTFYISFSSKVTTPPPIV